MGALAFLIIAIGGIIAFVTGIWLLVLAFQEHILWGLGSIFVPFVNLIFVIMHWDVAKRPFLYSLLGGAVTLVGFVLYALTAQPSAMPM